MASQNMTNPSVNPDIEDELFQKEVEAVKTWWSDSRWRHTKRPFTAEQIVSKRGYLPIDYASNAQAKKLWKILEHRFEVSRHRCLPACNQEPNTDCCYRTAMPAIPTAA
jgi:isocitrate lyase